jgi:ribosomal-protein-alanine N-acetyltransferase
MRHSDSAAWCAYLTDPRVVEHTSIPELTLTLVEAMVAHELDGYVAGSSCRWALADANDRLVGTCGFSNWSLPHSHAELAYDLAPAFWGRGLMRRAVHQVLSLALDNVGFNRVHAFVMTTNVPSIRLLEALGLSREGTLRRFRIARGVARDFHVYSVLRA